MWTTFNIYQDVISISLHKIIRDSYLYCCGFRTPRVKYGFNKWGTHIFDLKLCIQWYIWFCCISRIDINITNWKVHSTLPKWHWSYSCYITVRKQACPLNVLLFWATYPGTISRLLWKGVCQWIWQFFLSALNWRFGDYIEFLFSHHMFCLAWVTLQAGYLLAFRDIWFAAKYYGTHEQTYMYVCLPQYIIYSFRICIYRCNIERYINNICIAMQCNWDKKA